MGPLQLGSACTLTHCKDPFANSWGPNPVNGTEKLALWHKLGELSTGRTRRWPFRQADEEDRPQFLADAGSMTAQAHL